jgi:hypothetical protein
MRFAKNSRHPEKTVTSSEAKLGSFEQELQKLARLLLDMYVDAQDDHSAEGGNRHPFDGSSSKQ